MFNLVQSSILESALALDVLSMSQEIESHVICIMSIPKDNIESLLER